MDGYFEVIAVQPLVNVRERVKRNLLFSRSGQMQMGEMVLVLVVAFIIGIAALTFFVQRSGAENERANSAQQQRDLAITAKSIASLPGIRYSLDGREDLTVIDMARANAFKGIIAESVFQEVYRERYAGYKAEIKPIYPDAAAYSPVLLFDYTDASLATRNSVPFVIPVLIHEPISGANGFGLLTVTQVVG